MSRCFPYPPPGYVPKAAAAAATGVQPPADKLQKEREMLQKKEKKERKKEKKREKKATQQAEKLDIAGTSSKRDHKKRKHEDDNVAAQVTRKASKDVNEQLEKSALSEEHGAPCFVQTLCGSPESSQNSNKRRKVTVSASPNQTRNGIVRIKLLPMNQSRESESPDSMPVKSRVFEQQPVKNVGSDRSTIRRQSEVQPRSNAAKPFVAPVQNIMTKRKYGSPGLPVETQQQCVKVMRRADNAVQRLGHQLTQKGDSPGMPKQVNVQQRLKVIDGVDNAVERLGPQSTLKYDSPDMPTQVTLQQQYPKVMQRVDNAMERLVPQSTLKDDSPGMRKQVNPQQRPKVTQRVDNAVERLGPHLALNDDSPGMPKQVNLQQHPRVDNAVQRRLGPESTLKVIPRVDSWSSAKVVREVDNPPVKQRVEPALVKVVQKTSPQMSSKVIQRDSCQFPAEVLQIITVAVPPGQIATEQHAVLQKPKVSMEPSVFKQQQKDATAKEEPSFSGRSSEGAPVQEVQKSSLDRKSRKAEKKERKFADLFVTWNPLPIQMECAMDRDQDWLFGSSASIPDSSTSNCRVSDGSVPCQLTEQPFSLQQGAFHLPDVDLFQLPYVVPF